MLASCGCSLFGPSPSRVFTRLSDNVVVFFVSKRGMKRRPPPPGKPPIVPPAKQVLYHVTHAPWMKPADVKELLWRRHVYNNAILGLRKIFKKELEIKENAGLGIAALRKQEEEELDALLKENERRNEESARRRKEREEEEHEKAEREILKEIEEELEKREKGVKVRTKEVLDMIERSKNFVTMENLDEKLKEALENPVVYDFAVDLQGKRLYAPKPTKYLEGVPKRQKSRLYDVSLGEHQEQQAQQA